MRLNGFLEVDGVRLLCTDDGPVDAAETLMLVHGWGSQSTTWAALAPAWATQQRVISVDLRGHGSSADGPPASATIERMARDLEAVARRSEAQSIVAVGHSMGGNVATALALSRPDLVSGLVLVDPAYGADAAEMATVPARLAEYRRTGGQDPARAIDGAFSPDADPRLLFVARHSVLGTADDVLATAFESLYLGPDAFGSADAAPDVLARRRVPVLAVYPSEERAATERVAAARDGATPTTIVIGPAASHFLHEEEPAWFVALVREWVEGLG